MVNDRFLDAFIRTAHRFPERPALELNGSQLTYRELERSAKALAVMLQRASPRGPVALLARHSADAYVGLLGIHLSGHAHLPLSPEHPPSRNVEILRQAGSSCVLAEDVAKAVAATASNLPELVVLPLQREASDLQLASGWLSPPAMNDELAYVIFTSGTSGTPKGTCITHGNVAAAMSATNQRTCQ